MRVCRSSAVVDGINDHDDFVVSGIYDALVSHGYAASAGFGAVVAFWVIHHSIASRSASAFGHFLAVVRSISSGLLVRRAELIVTVTLCVSVTNLAVRVIAATHNGAAKVNH